MNDETTPAKVRLSEVLGPKVPKRAIVFAPQNSC